MSKRYINKEKVYLLEEYKKKLYNSEIEYVPSKKGTELHIIFPL